jgi:hypothetical protein
MSQEMEPKKYEQGTYPSFVFVSVVVVDNNECGDNDHDDDYHDNDVDRHHNDHDGDDNDHYDDIGQGDSSRNDSALYLEAPNFNIGSNTD